MTGYIGIRKYFGNITGLIRAFVRGDRIKQNDLKNIFFTLMKRSI